ncbi:hypothetical protein ILUMI_01061 [Ignelater luminosus]|uniref:Uncharacterized protein n=1 Tax=Ignelater luminosus TaxID=2038154 RepID=A0A8K0GKL8_IGNLU|nr:hypothetical protein ILUMI_01061 [Ignelater luminosus]
MSTPTKYKVRPGTIDSGKVYEIKTVALLCLKCCLEDLEHFWIASNVNECGALDDIILFKKERNKKGVTYLIQVKHQDAAKDVVKDQILALDGNFSLKRYLDSCLKLSDTISNQTTKKSDIIDHLRNNPQMVYILFTNKDIAGDFEFLEPNTSGSDLINVNGNVYGFKQEKLNILTGPNDPRERFIKKIFLYTKQPHIKEIDNDIKTVFKKLTGVISKLDKDLDAILRQFLFFVEEWSKGLLDGHYPLTQELVLRKVTEILLEPFMVQLSEQVLTTEAGVEKMHGLWNEMIPGKNLIVVNESDEIVDNFMEGFVCGFAIKHKGAVQNCTKLKKDLMRIPGKHRLDCCSEFYEYLWKTRRIPLMVQAFSKKEIEEITEILKISQESYRIMILNKSKATLAHLKFSNFLLTVSDLTQQKRKELYNLPIKLQGRDFPGYKKLNFDGIPELTTRDILYILCNKFNVAREFEELPHVFVNITLKRVWLEPGVLEKAYKNNLIILCASTENFKKFIRRTILDDGSLQITRWNNTANFDFEKHRIVCCTSLADFKNIENCLQNNKNRPIHFLNFHNSSKLEWVKSCGTVNNLKEFRIAEEKLEEEPLTASEAIINFCNEKKPAIISSNPGMGKSVFVNYFARNTPIDFWVIKIDLMKYKNILIEPTLSFNLDSLFEQILEQECKENLPLVKAVFAKFNETKNIVVLLDGFDEIPISYQKCAKEFIKFIKESGYFVLITTRPVFKHDLETLLDTLSLDLNLFSRKNQRDFLESYFSSYSETTCKAETNAYFVESLLNAAGSNLNDHDNKFTGVPLQTLLLAEVFMEDFNQFVKTKNFVNTHFDLLFLYRNFIEKKLRIACEKFGQISEDIKHHYKVCRSLYALRLVFSEEDLNELQIDLKLEYGKSLFPHMLELLQKDGIVVAETEATVRFIHQTFAGYLAAEWLAENIETKNEGIAKRLLTATFDPNLKFVRNIFDRILANGRPLHLAIINFQTDKAITLINSKHFDDVDDGSRNCLHLIASWGFQHPRECEILFTYIKMMSRKDEMSVTLNVISDEKLNNCRDRILGYTPVDYAIISSSLHIANRLCLRMEHLRISINIENPKTSWLLDHCAYSRYFSLERVLIIYKSIDSRLLIDKDENSLSYIVSKGNAKKLNELALAGRNVNEKDKFGLTPLHVAVRTAMTEMVEILIRNGANTNATDSSGKTPLHWSVIEGSLDILKLLLAAKGMDANVVDDHGRTALHYAVIVRPQHQIEIIRTLWVTDYDITDENGRTPLVWAAHLGYTECADWFLDDVSREQINESLHCAVRNEHIDTVKLLLSNGANVYVGFNGVTALIDSVVYGNATVLLYLLCNGMDVKSEEHDGTPVLCLAAIAGHVDIVKMLLYRGVDIESKDKNGHRSLHFAAFHGREDVVELLLSKGASINAEDNDGGTALLYAVLGGYTQIVTLLLSKGSEIPAKSLHMSAGRGFVDLTNFLLYKNMDVNLRDGGGMTALHRAAENGHQEIVVLLLTKRANIEAKNYSGETPLILAVKEGHREVTNVLIAEGADIETKTSNDETPLIVSVKFDRNEITKLLIAKGAKINVFVFHLAVGNPNSTLETIELFLSKSPDLLELRTAKQNTPLISATQGGCEGIVQLLLSKNANIKAKDENGMSALHWASFKGYKGIAFLLLQNNADLEAEDNEGKTALIHAARNGHEEVVSILLFNKADRNVKDTSGLTAYDWARHRNHKGVVRLLN